MIKLFFEDEFMFKILTIFLLFWLCSCQNNVRVFMNQEVYLSLTYDRITNSVYSNKILQDLNLESFHPIPNWVFNSSMEYQDEFDDIYVYYKSCGIGSDLESARSNAYSNRLNTLYDQIKNNAVQMLELGDHYGYYEIDSNQISIKNPDFIHINSISNVSNCCLLVENTTLTQRNISYCYIFYNKIFLRDFVNSFNYYQNRMIQDNGNCRYYARKSLVSYQIIWNSETPVPRWVNKKWEDIDADNMHTIYYTVNALGKNPENARLNVMNRCEMVSKSFLKTYIDHYLFHRHK